MIPQRRKLGGFDRQRALGLRVACCGPARTPTTRAGTTHSPHRTRTRRPTGLRRNRGGGRRRPGHMVRACRGFLAPPSTPPPRPELDLCCGGRLGALLDVHARGFASSAAEQQVRGGGGGGGLNTSAASRPASARGKGTSVRCSGTASASSASDQEGERVAGPGDLGGRGGCVVEEGPTRRRGQPSAGQGPGRARPVGTRWSARRATRQTNETGGQARPGGPETAPPLLRSHFAEPRPQTGLARPGSVPLPPRCRSHAAPAATKGRHHWRTGELVGREDTGRTAGCRGGAASA